MAVEFPILLSSAGRRVELLRLLRQDAAELGLAPRVIAVDACPELSAACVEADAAYAVPRAGHPQFLPALMDVCRREGVRLLVPTIDPELRPLAEAREELGRLGVFVAVSAPAVVRIAGDKLSTSESLSAHGVGTPRTARAEQVLEAPGSWRWPLMAKPIAGSASVGVRVVHGPAELETAAGLEDDLVVQELVEGPEYTVNMFVDPQGECRAAVPHLRRELRAGEVSKGITVRDQTLALMARRIAAALPGALGPLCFQAIRSSDGPKVIEINARLGGGFPLAHRAGARFTRWLVEMASGREPTACDDWREGVWMLRYDQSVFGVLDTGAGAGPWLG